MANTLTAVRLLLVIPFAVFMSRADERSAFFALIAWVVALATDFLDGPIARRRGTVSALSGAFDHTLRCERHIRERISWGIPVDIARLHRRGICSVRHRLLLVSPADQISREQTGTLQRNALLRPTHRGHSDSLGRPGAPAVAYDFGVGTGFEHAGIHGPALHVQQIRLCRTPPESLAGEIAGRLRH
jgi:hypothetical protein